MCAHKNYSSIILHEILIVTLLDCEFVIISELKSEDFSERSSYINIMSYFKYRKHLQVVILIIETNWNEKESLKTSVNDLINLKLKMKEHS